MTLEFKNNGSEFSALNEARGWLDRNGYSYGSLCGPQPVGILRGEYTIVKWRNLSAKDIRDLDGMMTAPVDGGWRNGDVLVEIKEQP